MFSLRVEVFLNIMRYLDIKTNIRRVGASGSVQPGLSKVPLGCPGGQGQSWPAANPRPGLSSESHKISKKLQLLRLQAACFFSKGEKRALCSRTMLALLCSTVWPSAAGSSPLPAQRAETGHHLITGVGQESNPGQSILHCPPPHSPAPGDCHRTEAKLGGSHCQAGSCCKAGNANKFRIDGKGWLCWGSELHEMHIAIALMYVSTWPGRAFQPVKSTGWSRSSSH